MLSLMETGKQSGVVRTQEFCLPYQVEIEIEYEPGCVLESLWTRCTT